MSNFLTRVHTHFGRNLFNYYIRFGEPLYRDEFSGRQAFEYFSTGTIFGYIRWITNDYGTKSWRFFILRGGDETTPICKIQGVTPGAEILADISGKERVHRLFKVVDQMEAAKIDCSDVPDWYWIHANARINSSLDPLPYTQDQHRSWLMEQEVRA